VPNWKLTIAYDGTEYHGWQVQPQQRTVQGELNDVLEKLFGKRIKTVGASRTDAGVHATGQVVSVKLPRKYETIELHRRMNLMLPDTIAVHKIEEAADDFSARYSARGKRYEYRITFEKNPHKRNTALWLMRRPDLDFLQRLSELISGEHNFTGFAKLQSVPEHPMCTIYNAQWLPTGNGTVFVIEGNRFLHTMVRSIVGAMLDCERGRFSTEQFAEMLESGKRKYEHKVANAKGLWLVEVFY